MGTSTDMESTAEDAPRVDLDSLALRMAINNHAVIETDIGSPYLEGRRDAYLLMAVALEQAARPVPGSHKAIPIATERCAHP